jgi:hypothetical protein
MRKTLIAALIVSAASFTTPASTMQLAPNPDFSNPSLQTRSGRRHLCRVHLETQGYPNSYLHRRGSRGLIGACSRSLWRKWKHPHA